MTAHELPEIPSTPWRAEPDIAATRGGTLPKSVEVCVVGAGIAGIATASMLAEAGATVALLDARAPGCGTTGHSSAKVSVLHGTHAQKIEQVSGRATADLYLQANRWGAAWVAGEVEQGADCEWERRPGVTYASHPDDADELRREAELLRANGIESSVEELSLPWGSCEAVVCPEQAQFDPTRFAGHMTERLAEDGVGLHWPVRVIDIDDGHGGVTVHTDAGDLEAGHVVLATGLPLLDRGLHFARTVPRTSHVVGVRTELIPDPGMYLGTGSPTRSVRTAIDESGEQIVLIGGEGHRTGADVDTIERQRTLVEWADRHLGVTEVTHRFSAEDYTTPDHVPFAGPIHGGKTRVYVATGFNKWGFSNAPAAARVIAGHIGAIDPPAWSEAFSSTRLPLSGALDLAKAGLAVAKHAASGWASSIRKDPFHPGRPVGTGPDRPCVASGVCPHLGGIVRWNEAAGTFDCPLHGSRFGPDGTVQHGPAVRDLPRS